MRTTLYLAQPLAGQHLWGLLRNQNGSRTLRPKLIGLAAFDLAVVTQRIYKTRTAKDRWLIQARVLFWNFPQPKTMEVGARTYSLWSKPQAKDHALPTASDSRCHPDVRSEQSWADLILPNLHQSNVCYENRSSDLASVASGRNSSSEKVPSDISLPKCLSARLILRYPYANSPAPAHPMHM